MPNNVETTLTVSGEMSEIKKLVDLMKGETPFDFNKIVKMPEELKNVKSGFITIDGKKVKVWHIVDGKDVTIPKETLAKWRRKFGADNWYDWASNNWGTKWNAYDVTKWAFSFNEAEIQFVTAWASPESLIKEIAARFPKLAFEAIVGGEVDEPYTYNYGGQ